MVTQVRSYVVSTFQQVWAGRNTKEQSRQLTTTDQHCRRFSLAEIKSATQGFSEELVIGKGGFGKVYKGLINSTREVVAIKRLSSGSKQGADEFWMEIETLSKLRHVHLVSLIGYCNEPPEMILVYEYMQQGTLVDHLYKSKGDEENHAPLDWEQRLKICIGAARGLDYLHTGTAPGVIHRDVKDSNILLDDKFVAKVADFGLAKLEKTSPLQSHVSTDVKGTFGYMDMDYFYTRRLSKKSDVYAFGVVLLVVLCGRPAVDTSLEEDKTSLVLWAQECISKGIVDQIIDPYLSGRISASSLDEFIKVTNKCLHRQRKRRPSMAQVVGGLELALEKQLRSSISSSEEMANVGMHRGAANTQSVSSMLENFTIIDMEKLLSSSDETFQSCGTNEETLEGVGLATFAIEDMNIVFPDSTFPGRPQRLPSTSPPSGAFGISQYELAHMVREHNIYTLQEYGGVKGVADQLKSNLGKGIHGDAPGILMRKNAFGSNTYPRRRRHSFWRFLRDEASQSVLIILMVAAAASLALGIYTEGVKEGWYNGVSISFAVITMIVASAINDYAQYLQFECLNDEKQHISLEVIRDGRRVGLSIFDVVVGDIVPLKIGDQVPADGLFISGHSLAVDESSLTGENMFVLKDSVAPFLMSGTKVADGHGIMLVTSVGKNTEWGLIMASISEDYLIKTPLQARLEKLCTYIGMAGLLLALSISVVLLVLYFSGRSKNPDGSVQFRAGETSAAQASYGALQNFIVAVTIVVVTVPEGGPLAVTVMLAYSIKKMMADKALVRRLSACETMGSATTICCSKTGILTLNQMTVVKAYVCGRNLDLFDDMPILPPSALSLLLESIANNTLGSVFMPEGCQAAEFFGSPTEKAILQWGVKLGMNFDAIRSNSEIIHAFPFDPEKKCGGVAVKLSDSGTHIHWRGAAEVILPLCSSYIDENDNVVPMHKQKVSLFKKAIEDMTAASLRCVVIAYRSSWLDKVPTRKKELEHWQLPEEDLILLAVIGIKDPCRPGVRDAIRLCNNSGIKVRMVTGDSIQTAKAIALECGILESGSETFEPHVIDGMTFRRLSETQRLEVAEKISVMGRASPVDKLLLVLALRSRGHVVALTGNGFKDASALNEADISLAMGIAGTQVTKETSDIMLLDDNFATVVKLVRWGRSVYANIQKFIQFQLTLIFVAGIINVVLAAVSWGGTPLSAVQLLWVAFIMDTLGALALATESPTDHVMHRPPVSKRNMSHVFAISAHVAFREPLITNIMWRNIFIQALYQVTILLILNFCGESILHLEHGTPDPTNKVKNTLIFNTFVLCQIFNKFNSRKPDEMNVFKGIFRNRFFMPVVVLTMVLQVVIITFLGKFTSSVRLSWKLWLVSIAIGFISWPLAAIGKLVPVPERPFAEYLMKRVMRRQRAETVA